MNKHERISAALHEYAEMRVPETADPWPEIREQVAIGERSRRRSSQRPRFAPRMKMGWTFAALIALFAVSTGALAAGGIMDVLDFISGETVPYIQKHKLGTPVGEEISRDGVTVTIDRVYADSAYVVVGFHVKGLGKLGDKSDNPRDDLFARMGLSDPTGSKEFVMTRGHWQSWVPSNDAAPGVPTPPKGSQASVVVFESPTRLNSGENYRFQAKVSLFNRIDSRRPILPWFVFDLDVPVKSAPVIEVNQTVEANEIPITLTRVVNSPARAYAHLCFDPPKGKYDLPVVKTGFLGLGGGHIADIPVNHRNDVGGVAAEGCATYNFGKTLYDQPGRHYLTVTELYAADPEVRDTIKGPWRFSFKVPRQ